MMHKEQAKFYRERWKAVYEIEARERANLSLEEKLRQLSILFDFARSVHKGPERLPDSRVVERWVKLKERVHDASE